jgi:hypothetical protein
MKTKIQVIFLGLTVVLFSACDKKYTNSGFPSVITISAVPTGNSSMKFSGQILWRNPGEINEYGFIWQTNDDPVLKPGFKVNLGTKIKSDNFQSDVSYSIKKGSKYIVRAYALCGKTKIFGEKIEFISEIDLPTKLSEFKPSSGFLGDTITITGQKFNSTLAYNQVKFDTLTSKIISVNDTVLRCIVPLQLHTKFSTIKVITNGIEGTFSEKFTLLEPIITSVSSNKIKYGSTLTIYGINFNPASGVNSVIITGNSRTYTLTPSFVSTDSIKVEIYNQQSPTEILNLSSFTFGIKAFDRIYSSDVTVSLISSWKRTTDFPGAGRYMSSIFTLNGNCYIGAGAGYGVVLKDLWKFSPASESWSRMADLPGVARVYPRAVSDLSFGYLGSGYTADNSSRYQLYDFYKYDPLTNSWSVIPDYPDNIASYYVGYTVSVNGRPYISLSNSVLTMRELKNDIWSPVATIQDMIDCPASGVFAIGKKFYVVVGYRINNTLSNAVWEFDSDNGIWTKKTNFPGPARYAPAFFSIGNYGYYGCGMSTSSQQLKDIWRYEPAKDKWIRLEDFPAGIRSHLVSTSDGKSGFAGLGIIMSTVTYCNDFWRYDP